ncbi:hypothetical protein OAT67_04005 [Bacteriovoracaceae bacterium]|nr:hypothetical protein [Bacteriovoracaceae bacterium]
MKLFFSFLLLSTIQARPIIKIDYLSSQTDNKVFLEKHIREQYQVPEKFIQWNRVSECSAGDTTSVLHLCLKDEIQVLNMKPVLLEKMISGYLN